MQQYLFTHNPKIVDTHPSLSICNSAGLRVCSCDDYDKIPHQVHTVLTKGFLFIRVRQGLHTIQFVGSVRKSLCKLHQFTEISTAVA